MTNRFAQQQSRYSNPGPNKHRPPAARHKPSDVTRRNKAVAREANRINALSHERRNPARGWPAGPQTQPAAPHWIVPRDLRIPDWMTFDHDVANLHIGAGNAMARGSWLNRLLFAAALTYVLQHAAAQETAQHLTELPVCGPDGLASVLQEMIEGTPQRPKVSDRLLKKANIDPDSNCTVIVYPVNRLNGRQQSEPQQVQMTCRQAHLEKDVDGWVAQRRVAPALEGVASAKEVFDRAFDLHLTYSTSAIARTLEEGYKEKNVDLESDTAILSICVSRKDPMLAGAPVGCGHLGHLHRVTTAGEAQHYAIVPNQCNEVQSVPNDPDELIDWIKINWHLFFRAPLIDPDGPLQVVVEKVKEGLTLADAIDESARRIVNDVFSPLRTIFEAPTSFETWTHVLNDLTFPLYGTLRALEKGDYEEAVLSGVFDAATLVVPAARAGRGGWLMIKLARKLPGGLSKAAKLKHLRHGRKFTKVVVNSQRIAGNNNVAERLAKYLVENNTSKLAKNMSQGGVCWDAIISFQKEAGMISPATAQRLHRATRASKFDEFLKGGRQIATPTEFSKTAAGQRIGFVDVNDNTLKHAMITIGDGKAIGVNNGFLNPKFSPGWASIDLKRDLKWRNGLVHSKDGGVHMRLIVDGVSIG